MDRTHSGRGRLAWVAAALLLGPGGGRGQDRSFTWEKATPESQGVSSEKLAGLKETLAAHNTQGFLVARNDRIVYEWYADGFSPAKTHYTASLAKAVVGGLSLAVAVTDGKISIDDPVAKFVPQWKGDPRKSRVLVRHLGSHTSGLDDAHQDGVPHEKLPGWMGDFWKRLPPPDDPFTVSRDRTPVVFDTGTKFQYSNPGIAMLTYAVTAALRDGPHKDVRTLLRERVMRPIGVPAAEWSAGYGQTVTVDGLPLVGSWGGGNYSARALAGVGRLVLRGGDWDGKQLISRDAVRQMISSAGLPQDCGMGWWTNAGGRFPSLPKDAAWGHGAGDQLLIVFPSQNLIVVRYGGDIHPKGKGDAAARDATLANVLFDPVAGLVSAKQSGPAPSPYPLSTVITGITWAPKESIVRKAKDSDIWATTWADDGHLYTAYGDGTGFVPKVPEKLSQGLARIEGGPDDFTGVNVRSPTFEAKGDGPKGKKASGLLMVGGVLYAWVRNTGNAQLAWSADRGKTWEWADWTFTKGFGCPTFLNYGANYAGARDDFVYVYSHDADSAYSPAPRVVLARVSRGRIKERAAYEFFRWVNADGRPDWSKDPADCGAVFVNPLGCYRITVSYNAALKRYLLCQAGADWKAKAGFGVFDAPEPWGPWTTVTYVPQWDVDPGETCSLPTKWMSGDGKAVHLIFSGGDCFALRKATLTTK
jgi:CubicO group peptidase (beta-lactamase class C family)